MREGLRTPQKAVLRDEVPKAKARKKSQRHKRKRSCTHQPVGISPADGGKGKGKNLRIPFSRESYQVLFLNSNIKGRATPAKSTVPDASTCTCRGLAIGQNTKEQSSLFPFHCVCLYTTQQGEVTNMSQATKCEGMSILSCMYVHTIWATFLTGKHRHWPSAGRACHRGPA